MRRREQRRDRDEGWILPAAIVLVGVTGLLVAALAGYASVSFRHAAGVRDRSELRFSAQAGMDVVVDQLRHGQSLCAYTTTPVPVPVSISPNRATVTAECVLIDGTPQGMNGIAAVVTGTGPSALVQDGGPSSIVGSVYVADGAGVAANDLELRGDLWFSGWDCAAEPPGFPGITFSPSPPRGARCTSAPWQPLVPALTLPMPPPDEGDLRWNPPARDDVIPGCRVFAPGLYTAPPLLAAANYLASGVYVFDFDAPLMIGDATVIAGHASPPPGDPGPVLTGPCAGAGARTELQPFEQGRGTTLFLSGGARLDVGAGGELELFGRTQGRRTVAMAAVPEGAAGLGPSAIPADGPPIVGMDAAGAIIVHGDLQAPSAPVDLDGATAEVRGRVVAARLNLGAPSNGRPVIATTTVPRRTTMSVVARATDADDPDRVSEVHAVIDYGAPRTNLDGLEVEPALLEVESWRVS